MNRQEIIDVFCHWLPDAYFRKVERLAHGKLHMFERAKRIPVMVNLEKRFALMDHFAEYRQIPSLVSPPVESLAGADKSPQLAKVANDAAAGMVAKHPHRFPGFVASLPMNNPVELIKEAQRAVQQLGACGVQIYTNVNGRPIDQDEFTPLYELMSDLDAPIWLHPARGMQHADYTTESYSKYEIWWALGWLYETSVAMIRLAYRGIFDSWPNLKIITHHSGAFIPAAEGRLDSGMKMMGRRTPPDMQELVRTDLKENLSDTLKRFYVDVATFGSKLAIKAALTYFGIEKMLFASDMPFGPDQGRENIRQAIELVDELNITQDQKKKIYSETINNIIKR
jgi:aminocarboxymuconate-semialdehyde decarboxylase